MYCIYIMDPTNDKIYYYKYCNKTIKVKTLGAHLSEIQKKILKILAKGTLQKTKSAKWKICVLCDILRKTGRLSCIILGNSPRKS